VHSLADPVHVYFIPIGLALLAAAVTAGTLAARAWSALGRRLETARLALRGQARPTTDAPLDGVAVPSVAWLWLVLTVLQLGVWIVQENVEQGAAGLSMPGLRVLGGVHLLAPVVHAVIALGLASSVAALHRRFSRRTDQVRAHERLLARRRYVGVSLPLPQPVRSSTPLERWGAQRWQRPPPLLPI
jgi:hypothetical protein